MTIKGISSMATRNVLNALAAAFERRYGVRVAIESVGGLAAERRVAEGEAFDIVVLASKAIERLVEQGRVDAASRVGIARSGVAVAVKAGAHSVSIDTEIEVRDAVLAARTIGYSTGPSGEHVLRLFERWGIAQQVASRIVQAPAGIAVGTLIARGEVELGFQQTSELIGIDGIDVLGPLPREIQAITVFQGAVCKDARASLLARSLLAFLSSPETEDVKRAHGMEGV